MLSDFFSRPDADRDDDDFELDGDGTAGPVEADEIGTLCCCC